MTARRGMAGMMTRTSQTACLATRCSQGAENAILMIRNAIGVSTPLTF